MTPVTRPKRQKNPLYSVLHFEFMQIENKEDFNFCTYYL